MPMTFNEGGVVVTIAEQGDKPAGRLSDADRSKLSDAQKLDYCR
jgi:hypothetical protein